MDLSNPTSRWEELRNENPDIHEFLNALVRAEFDAGQAGVDPSSIAADALDDVESEGLVGWQGDANDLISFASNDLRREYLVRHAESLLQDSLDQTPEEFASSFRNVSNRAVQLGGVGENIPEVILILVAAGRAERVLSLFSELAKRAVEEDRESGRSPFWDLYQSLTNVLHRLDVGPEEVAQNAAPILKASSRDMMGGQLHGAVERMARQSEERADELYDTLISHTDPPVKSLATNALEGLSDWNFEEAHCRAIRLTEEETPIMKRIGIGSLGKVDYQGQDPSFLRETWERLEELAVDPDEETDYVLVRTLGDLLTAFESTTGTEGGEIPSTARVGGVLAEMAGRADQRVKQAVAQVLFLRGEHHLHSDWYQRALLQVADVPSTQAQTIRQLDACVRRYLNSEDPSPERALNFLREFVLQRNDSDDLSDHFVGLISSLREDHAQKLSDELTRWFSSPEPRLHREAANLYHHFSQMQRAEDVEAPAQRFQLSEEVLSELDDKETAHVMKRICGHIAGGGSLLADLIVSVLQQDSLSEELLQLAGELLFGFVLHNYPESGREALERSLDQDDLSEEAEQLIKRALESSEQYFDQLGDLPMLEEFQPPSHRRYLLRRAMLDQQAEIMEQVREQSDVLQLFSRLPLKYGSAFFSERHDGEFSEPAELKSHSHSRELPRDLLIDPVGLEYRRFRWRRAGLESNSSARDGKTNNTAER